MKTQKRRKQMTAACKMLEIMKATEKKGVPKAEAENRLKRIGVINREGEIAKKYSKIFTIKK